MEQASLPEYGRQRSAILITDRPGGGEIPLLLSELGGRALRPVAWAQSVAHLALQDETVAIIADAIGSAEETLVAVLPALADMLRYKDVPAVVRMEHEQIDLVASALFDTGALLLCDPTPGEDAAAVAALLSVGPRSALHEGSDGDQQLRKINEDIARIAETLARLTRRTARNVESGGVADRMTSFTPAPNLETRVSAREVRDALRARRLRDQFLGEGMFEDPAWDMLLDLYAAELERAQVSVSSLCIAAHVAPTTALRWIGKMTERGLLVRQPDPFDRRRAFMALSHQASEGMAAYAAAIRQAGLHFA